VADLRQVTARNGSRGLIADSELEAGRAPIDKLDGALLLDGRDRGLNILGHDIIAEEQAARHELAVPRVTLDRLVAGLKAGHGQLGRARRVSAQGGHQASQGKGSVRGAGAGRAGARGA
jgi:hypothetical protein